jgi:hypothetical protein
MSPSKTRRQFVKATAAAAMTGALAAGGSSRAADAPVSPASRKTIQTDVLVCGGGCAGVAAALASARNGARTLLVERAGFAGGIITCVGLPYFDGLIVKQTGRFAAGGIPVELLVAMGAAKPGAKSIDDCRPDLITKYWGSVRVPSTEEFKLLTDRLLSEQRDHLAVLYHSFACEAEVRDGRIAAVLVANKDGLVRVEARQVIDCTGDGDIAAWAGAPVEKNQPLMPLTLHFRIGNVSPNKEMAHAAKQALIEANQRGELPLFYGPGFMFAFAKDEVYIHAVRVAGDASDAADLTRAEMQGRRDAWTMFREWKKSVPGFEDSYFVTCGPYIGIRESRRIVGQHVLSVDDLKTSRRYDDAIATGCWFLDIHPNQVSIEKPFAGTGFQPEPYDIPYRTLVPKGVSNLLVAGRCHSASAEAAASSRVTVTAMSLGQAAGTAAALAVKAREEVSLFPGVKVRETLQSQGAGPFTDA